MMNTKGFILMDKIDSMQEKMSNVTRLMEILRIFKMLETKNTTTEMNNALDRLIRRLYMTAESLSLRISQQKPLKLKRKRSEKK